MATASALGVGFVSILFKCPGCGRTLRASDSAAGKVKVCLSCQRAVTVPGVEPQSQAAAIAEVAPSLSYNRLRFELASIRLRKTPRYLCDLFGFGPGTLERVCFALLLGALVFGVNLVLSFAVGETPSRAIVLSCVAFSFVFCPIAVLVMVGKDEQLALRFAYILDNLPNAKAIWMEQRAKAKAEFSSRAVTDGRSDQSRVKESELPAPPRRLPKRSEAAHFPLRAAMPLAGPPSRGCPPTTKKCPFCAEVILVEARKCKHCGELLDPVLRAKSESGVATGPSVVVVRASGRSRGMAAVLEVIPGLFQVFGIGHMYAGRVGTGLFYMFGYWAIQCFNVVLAFCGIGVVLAVIFWVLMMITSPISAANSVDRKG